MTPTDPASAPRVELFVDPVCPFAYLAIRWLLEVETQRPIDLRLHIMSLAVLNEDNPDAPAEADRGLDSAWRPVRVGAAVAAECGEARLRDYLIAFGDRFHRQRVRPRDRALRETLDELEAPALIAEADFVERDDAVRRGHARAVESVGQDVGTPVLHIDGRPVFGPIFAVAPQGQNALDVFDGVVLLAGFSEFREIKRNRTMEPDFR